MRLRLILLFLLITTAFFLSTKKASADAICTEVIGECSGPCGTQTNTYVGTFTSTVCDGTAVYQCWDQNTIECTTTGLAENGVYWCPDGYSSVSCLYVCNPLDTGTSCIEETATVLCDCDLTPTPTPSPTGYESTVTTPTPTISTNPYITGNIQEDNDAYVSGSVCTQTSSSPLEIDGISLQAQTGSTTYNANISTTTPSDYSIYTVAEGSNYTVTLDLSGQTGLIDYVCSCPAAADPNNQHICSYSGIGAPSYNVNFYVTPGNLSNGSWFQVFGGSLFAEYGIASVVPYTYCSLDASCQSALSVPAPGSSDSLSSGFPIANAGSSSSIASYDDSSVAHSYLHLADRGGNVNAYDAGTGVNQASYAYLYKLVDSSIQEVGDGSSLKPMLSDWTSADWWQSSEANFVKVNGDLVIDETQNFDLSSGQSLVVFVDGNLTINDSNTGDSNYQITSVAQGGFLAFIVSGNITVSANVGYGLNPSSPTVPTVSMVNSNLQGVFVADGSLTIQTKTDIGEVAPDRKFIGAGTFVGWSGVNLDRTFDDGSLGPILNSNQAIDNFIYRPDLLANWPTKLKASLSNWREIDPRLINQ